MKEPKQSDSIYREIEKCEGYALMNLVTFEAAIRNSRVQEILKILNSKSSEEKLDALLDGSDKYIKLMEELREDYYLDYKDYRDYLESNCSFCERMLDSLIEVGMAFPFTQRKLIKENYFYDPNVYRGEVIKQGMSLEEFLEKYKQELSRFLHVNRNDGDAYIHKVSLPLYRPLLNAPQKHSMMSIEIPMYHIHPKEFESYYEKLYEAHKDMIDEAKGYYVEEELFYDETDSKKSKSSTYAEMFFVWDYVAWWKQENGTFTPEETSRGLYAEISEMIGASVDDRTGRSAKVEKHLVQMTSLIEKSEYKKFYIPKS